MSSIIDRARSWIAEDPDPETRRELETLIATHDIEALQERFSGGLQFGTAGLRGLLGAGSNRMNRVTVARATWGLCSWLKKQVPDAASRGICVGRDARVNSDVFEREVIEVATGHGIPVCVFNDLTPTPVLAFAVLELHAASGVMITASHNPPGYNGYKVYWENGAQIIAPNDWGIANEIEAAPRADRIPRRSLEDARNDGLVREIDWLRGDYVARIAAEASAPSERGELRVAYTALHGIAETTLRKVLLRAGFEDVHSVAEQSVPDGRFPTVVFPNPEEPGAMDRVLRLAEIVGADLVIANDPDGDRMAVAARNAAGFELLSGNDIGVLLGDDLLSRHREAPSPVVISTVVSSPMLGSVAASYGARWEQTLSGHKWIQNRAIELEQEGFSCVFSYEEALGYAPSRAVRDKDGISAALLMVDMAARLKLRGETLLDARDRLWRKHGFWADRQVSSRFDGPGAEARMLAVVEGYRKSPPIDIGGQAVTSMLDLRRRTKWTPAGETPFTGFAPSDLLIFELEGGHRVMVRPSGTEPKVKHYFYATARGDAGHDLAAAKKQALIVLERMVADLTRVHPGDKAREGAT
jgi:phosphomannomutase